MLVPIVKADGSIGEIELPDEQGNYLRSSDDGFKRQTLGVTCSDLNQVAFVDIYISENFLPQVKPELREEAIKKWLMTEQRLAWFFSYGKRIPSP